LNIFDACAGASSC